MDLVTYRYANKDRAFLLNNIFMIRSDTCIHSRNIGQSEYFLLCTEAVDAAELRVLGGSEFVSLSLKVGTGLGISQLPIVGSER